MHRPRPHRSSAGISLIEVMLVLVVIGVLAAMAIPRFGTATEQAHVDQAAAALRSVWVAERLWWLEEHAFCGSTDELLEQRLLDRSLVEQTAPFTLLIEGASEDAFTARMMRTGSDAWSGELVIDERGDVTGFSAGESGLHVLPPGQ
ncbi:MAG TPA: prepilin-type N-terminal cleavage/methylation domain-containing protein [Planctomycetota bacterium]|nr:prepilin-type N-terminal cleavage/methylation domain-containing protein [Planctomycetota bacterium]